MSDPSKSLPTFSFAATATSGGSSNLFGQNPSNTSKPPGNSLFGTSSNTPSASTSNLSGSNTGTAPTNPLFGANTQKPSSFGAGQQASGNSSIFGGVGESGPNGFIFGSGPTSNASKTGSSSGFTGFSTPSKPADTSTAGQSSNMFGTAGNPGAGGFFGNAGSSASSGQANATPASKPNAGFSFGSTTPAGLPPSSNAAPGGTTGSIFNPNKPQEGNVTNTSTLFGTLAGTKTSAQSSGGATAPSNLLGGFSQPSGSLFGQSGSNGKASSVQPQGGLFGVPQSNSSSSHFGNKAPPPGGDMFGNTDKPREGEHGNPTSNVAPGGSSLFGQPTASGASTTAPAAASTTTSTGGISSSLGANLTTPSTTNPFLGRSASWAPDPSSSADNASNPLSNFLQPKSYPDVGLGNPTPNVTASGSGLFGQPKRSEASATAPAAASTTTSTENTSTAITTAPSSTSALGPFASLYSNAGQPGTSAATSQPTTQAPTTGSSTGTGTANANLGASTSGPAPTAQSRLKNKSMDEIITRWASDLSKYQKEFQKQAERVAAWDRMLVENSEKIQKLYGSTLEAERATTEVERQLTAVENDQDELEMWLNYYEKEVDKLTSDQVGYGESLQGPDQERERTYNLAERLSDRLDEVGKDLGSMIEEINDASSTLNKNSKADDPLSQVVRVLNSHLTQLQQIDQGAAALQLKVAAAQKAGQNTGTSNGFNGPISDAADGFYRSYMGRR